MKNNFFKKAIVTTSFVGALTIGAGVASAESVTVQSGDSLWKFSQQYGVSIYKIKELNGLSSHLIYPGQTLKISDDSSSSSKVTTSSNATTYTVQAGDYLSKIGAEYGVSYRDIMKWNNLSSTIIYVGQTLKLEGTTSTQTSNTASSSSSSSNATTYTVQSGDYLSKIGAKFGVSYRDIMKWNNLNSTVIYVGQKLSIDGSSSSTTSNVSQTSTSSNTSTSGLISTAKQYMGTPYVWGGTSPSGFDCSGYLNYVFAKNGTDLPRTVAQIYNAGSSVSSPQVGDLVFYETYKAGPSHAGIYLGNGQFIHAGSDGVTISNMNISYWKNRYLGAKSY
ncbi:C40 family peptidase [Thalassobacillus devorans]|uniref:C40 family peptidase n=1 Tax=Thalassobacillus devorans TaxID=279813 RepID=UPI00048B3A8A|nr:C40 family peptidase [Thalassobacillus devorans]